MPARTFGAPQTTCSVSPSRRDLADRQGIGVRVPHDREHLPHDHTVQGRTGRGHGLDFEPRHRESRGQFPGNSAQSRIFASGAFGRGRLAVSRGKLPPSQFFPASLAEEFAQPCDTDLHPATLS